LGRAHLGAQRRRREIYVSHIDVSAVQCYKTIARYEILDRFIGGRSSQDVSDRAISNPDGRLLAAFRTTV
ncbi:hypothetical protein, partial [Bradyrhizobium sp. STM 3809]|uniref:hypothetical protein n=1 Tax=Bradyrhizobium sp. STM 3809 TaxID=551936 RepID=UPI001AEC7147